MADISKCLGIKCNLKETCYRYKAKNSFWQSYFTKPPNKDSNTCEHYWELK